MMRQIQGVSFPRTGHSLMLNYLMRYFSRDLNWIENVNDYLTDGLMYARPFVYCESYGHCHQSPCPHADTTFQKDHDFDSTIEYRADQYYLVQNRDPLPAIISHYKLSLRDLPKQQSFTLKSLFNPDDSMRNWKRFYLERLNNWLDFQDKWVQPKHSNVYVLNYNDMAERPMEKIREVIQFLDSSHEIDEAWYGQSVESIDVHSKDTVRSFKYYDAWSQKMADEFVQRGKFRQVA